MTQPTPAETLFALCVLSLKRDANPAAALAAERAFYRLTQLARARGVRNRTKLDRFARYGKYTPGARAQYELAAATLTPAELERELHAAAVWCGG